MIRAPSAGVILTKGIEAGELAAPGRTIAVLADLARIELKIYVPESEIGKIKLNDPARVRVDAFPQRTFDARVARRQSSPEKRGESHENRHHRSQRPAVGNERQRR